MTNIKYLLIMFFVAKGFFPYLQTTCYRYDERVLMADNKSQVEVRVGLWEGVDVLITEVKNDLWLHDKDIIDVRKEPTND